MDTVWYMLGMLAIVVGVKYWWDSNNPPPRSQKKVASNELAYKQLPGELITEIDDKWKRPLPKLPVHVDIPRLARKINVYSATSSAKEAVLIGKEDNDGTPNDIVQHNDNMVVKDLIISIATHMGESTEQIENIKTNFAECYKKTGDPSQALADLLANVVGHESRTAKVLKACNQSILAPGVLVCRSNII